MLAYMNRNSWLKTLETGWATYWSRSRNALWVKGEISGNIQIVKDILIDCDSDTILLKVEQIGGSACHTGYNTCFYRRLSGGKVEIVGRKIFNPEEVYK
jgi:Phosphoribosyl-AMP cyclohydrolase